ncbi:hypothetical protein FN846DRAFT_922796 [Sphaerosporella brunnea]|uniref:Uncharacterized protein n=1 Tax=Sphaerosporella brunnea TaxID=1250544 RepID=A0A5J5EHU5_9PEZI|nr:hypothetical protein FN846DRAFT_922796 [Sphaerosporella brunnea]
MMSPINADKLAIIKAVDDGTGTASLGTSIVNARLSHDEPKQPASDNKEDASDIISAASIAANKMVQLIVSGNGRGMSFMLAEGSATEQHVQQSQRRSEPKRLGDVAAVGNFVDPYDAVRDQSLDDTTELLKGHQEASTRKSPTGACEVHSRRPNKTELNDLHHELKLSPLVIASRHLAIRIREELSISHEKPRESLVIQANELAEQIRANIGRK